MGYTTEFRGAFRITPKVDPILACRLNLWLGSRHYIRAFDAKKCRGYDTVWETRGARRIYHALSEKSIRAYGSTGLQSLDSRPYDQY